QMLASIRCLQRRRAEALQAVDSCLRLAPENVHALNQRSLILRSRWDHRSADVAAQEAMALDPENSLAHVNYGLSHAAQGAYHKAFAEFEEALRLDPHSHAAHAGILQTRNQRAIAVMLGFFALVGVFLAFVAYSAGALGCFESAV